VDPDAQLLIKPTGSGVARVSECRGAPGTPLKLPGDSIEHLLLTVGPDSGSHVVLGGLALIGRGGELSQPPHVPWQATGPNPFARQGLVPGRRFTLLLWGRPTGTATVDSSGRNHAWASRSGTPAAARASLAVDLPADSGEAPLYQATPAERATLRALLNDTLEAHMYGWDDRHEARDLVVNAVRLRGDSTALVGSYVERTETAATDNPFMGAFMIAERDRAGVYRATYSAIWGDPGDEVPYTPELYDVVDLDRDGVPELVTVTNVSMGSDRFSVFHRGPAGWREVLRSGC
jgi:hypothetical protein